jgi:phosphoglycolate phosphatase
MAGPILRPPRAILFDWDNTLVDGWAAIADAMNAALDLVGQPTWTVAETKSRVRGSLRDSFPRMFGSRSEEATRVFYERFAANHLACVRPMIGAGDLLPWLVGRGIYLGIVSNKTGPYLRLEVEHLGWAGHFRRVVGAGDAAHDKPAVDPVDMALAESGIARGAEVWFVGDADIDMDCAVRAGCLPILLRIEAPGAGEFGASEPVFHGRDSRDLRRLIEAL